VGPISGVLVVAIIALVILNYRQLVIRYPQGGGASAPVGKAFGDRWSFIPIGPLVVDFVLTIAISVSSGVSAAIAYFPALAPWRPGGCCSRCHSPTSPGACRLSAARED
jgi:amino acid transporter